MFTDISMKLVKSFRINITTTILISALNMILKSMIFKENSGKLRKIIYTIVLIIKILNYKAQEVVTLIS